MEKYLTKEQLVEVYCLGRKEDISIGYLHALKKWAHYKKIGSLTWSTAYEWYIGFDRPLTKLMKQNLFVMEGISLWFPLYNKEA